ncbi:hypothetical protein, partial [Salmonella sp. E404]|uniref:hypothetical protein n=1 Tax=Salmonella sp. E404 TaxID=3240325 RepID=UPI003529F16E
NRPSKPKKKQFEYCVNPANARFQLRRRKRRFCFSDRKSLYPENMRTIYGAFSPPGIIGLSL